MSSGKARYAQRDVGSKGVERWDLNTTRQLTHSCLREGGFECLDVKQTRLLTHSTASAVDNTGRNRFTFSLRTAWQGVVGVGGAAGVAPL